jgi:tRNA threonylcarbamoyladenosine biosynthesis protein TsaE
VNDARVLSRRTRAVEETRELAAAIAEVVRAGDLLLLVGDLGAGKTAFAQGFARGLQVDEVVTSPTFTLAREYEGRIRLNHLDVYRLDNLQELTDLALSELLDGEAVTLIEWGDAVAAALPAEFLEVRLAMGDADTDDDERVVALRPVGRAWISRLRTLDDATKRWSE